MFKPDVTENECDHNSLFDYSARTSLQQPLGINEPKGLVIYTLECNGDDMSLGGA